MQDNFEETNPKYYQSGFTAEELQCIDITRHLKFAPGNAFKYIWRAGKKSSESREKDLRKAIWYLYDWAAWNPVTHVGGEHNEAKVIFHMIKPDNSKQYDALACIINHDIYGAISLVKSMLRDENIYIEEE